MLGPRQHDHACDRGGAEPQQKYERLTPVLRGDDKAMELRAFGRPPRRAWFMEAVGGVDPRYISREVRRFGRAASTGQSLYRWRCDTWIIRKRPRLPGDAEDPSERVTPAGS